MGEQIAFERNHVAAAIRPESPVRRSRRKLECLMTADEAAAYLRFSKRLIWQRAKNNDIPHIRIFGRIRFRRAELDAWLDELESRALDS